MAIQISDGLGKGYVAGVTSDNRLEVVSKTNPRLFYVSKQEQRAFNAVFADASAAAGDYVAYIKNTSVTRSLVINFVLAGAANAARWRFGTATGTATGGTAVTAVNLNRQSSVAASATLLADAVGGFTAGTSFIATGRHPANSLFTFPVDDAVILGQNDAVFIQYLTGTTGEASVTVRFYYDSL